MSKLRQCSNCEYKRMNKDSELHCYMFKEEVKNCGQFKPINVGTAGHRDHRVEKVRTS